MNPLKLNRKYIEANKRVWEHGRDYYRISNEYQQYEHNFDDFGIGASKLTEIALAIKMDNLDQWTSQVFQIWPNLSNTLLKETLRIGRFFYSRICEVKPQ